MDCLRKKGVVVGLTTVYRVLERMVDDGKMMKLPMEDGTKVRYCFAGEEDWDKLGKLVCMGCGRLIPLECSKMADFLEHIYKEHGFELIRNTQSCMAIVNAVTIRGLSRRLVCDGKMAFRTKVLLRNVFLQGY